MTRRGFLAAVGGCLGVVVLGADVTPLAPALVRRWRGRGGRLCHVETDDPVVALTFDDGPDPRYTPAVLEELRRQGAHATFFVIGAKVVGFPGIVAREVAEGHTVGNHTYDHALLQRLAADQVAAEIASGTRALVDAGAPPPTFFRPPWGELPADDRVDRITARLGLRTILWDVAVEHYVNHEAMTNAVDQLLTVVMPGSIMLAHDGAPGHEVIDRSRTLAALPRLLDGLHHRGYEVVDVATLLSHATVTPRPWDPSALLQVN